MRQVRGVRQKVWPAILYVSVLCAASCGGSSDSPEMPGAPSSPSAPVVPPPLEIQVQRALASLGPTNLAFVGIGLLPPSIVYSVCMGIANVSAQPVSYGAE